MNKFFKYFFNIYQIIPLFVMAMKSQPENEEQKKIDILWGACRLYLYL
jgi:hypothetical protein